MRVLPFLACGVFLSTRLAAQDEPRRFVRFEVGQAEIHHASSTGGMLALRWGHRADTRGLSRVELGASYSRADQGYVTFELGGELRPISLGPIRPVLAAGAGIIGESDFVGALLRVTVGLEMRVSSAVVLRLAAQWGEHGGVYPPIPVRGPNALFGAIEMCTR